MITDSETKQEVMAPSAIEAISAAEINSAIATARRFPRQLSVVKKNMISFATLDQETAESCFYTLPRGGKNIQGPSVRLAEIAVSCYGNIRAGSRVIQSVTEGDNPHVVVQAVCMDLENNVSVSVEKRRRIIGKKDYKTGTRKPVDEDDINLAANAGAAIAFRDAIFKVVPLALIKPVFDQAKKVAVGDARTLNDRRAACIAHFAKMGIPQDRVLAKLEVKSIEDVTLDHVETLLGLHNAIKDGEITLDDAFPTAAKAAQPKFEAPTPEQSPGKNPTVPAAAGEPPSSSDKAASPGVQSSANPELDALLAAITPHGITAAQLFAVAKAKGLVKSETLEQLRPITLKNLARIISKGDEQGKAWIEEAAKAVRE